MNEQLLKDFIATAEAYNYDWNTIFGKFPELQGYDQQVLKDYVATAQANGYNYAVVNPKFPELGFGSSVVEQAFTTANQIAATPQKSARTGELPRMPKPGELDNIGKEDENAAFDSQGNYHPENAMPEPLRATAQKLQAEKEAKKKRGAAGGLRRAEGSRQETNGNWRIGFRIGFICSTKSCGIYCKTTRRSFFIGITATRSRHSEDAVLKE